MQFVTRYISPGDGNPSGPLQIMYGIDGRTELTERELDVLRLIAEGESNATIAGKLVLSEKTVKGHVSNILSKLHIADRTQAAALAWQQGLMVQ